LLYLVDPGKPSNKKEKNVDGTLVVVALADRKLVASVPAGSGPRAIVWDAPREQALLTSDGPPVEKGLPRPGVLRLLKAGEVVATLEVAEAPHLVRISGSQAYVTGRQAISVVDLEARRVAGQIAVEHAGGIDELVFSPDAKRAFALYDGSSRLSVLDLEKAQLVGSVTTGRGGIKFAKALGSVALSVAATTASYYSGMAGAQARGGGYYTYNVYSFGVAAAETSVAVRPDGRFAYALNTQTNDVTVVDTTTATVLSKEAARGRSLAPLTGGTRFAVLGKDELRIFDTETQKPGEPLAFEDADAVRLRFSDDGATAIAYGGSGCYVLDGRTGAVRSRVDGLLGVSDVLFAGAPQAPPAPETPPAPVLVSGAGDPPATTRP
jgi:DNA-binding beta-propeller fold protein YncE